MLALEVAVRLQMRNEDVDVVFLFDAILRDAARRNWPSWFKHQTSRVFHGEAVDIARRFLRRRGGRVSAAANELLENLTDDERPRRIFATINRAYRKAMDEYAGPPQPFDGTVVLFRAQDWSPWIVRDADYGWGRISVVISRFSMYPATI